MTPDEIRALARADYERIRDEVRRQASEEIDRITAQRDRLRTMIRFMEDFYTDLAEIHTGANDDIEGYGPGDDNILQPGDMTD